MRKHRVEALKSLLPLLLRYLDYSPLYRLVTHFGDTRGGEIDPGADFAFMGAKAKLYSQYRLGAVARSLEKLCDHDILLARATWYEYVDPWPVYEPYRRKRLAKEGLAWMADEIPGELYPYEEDKRERAARLKKEGWSNKSICRVVGISERDIPKGERCPNDST